MSITTKNKLKQLKNAHKIEHAKVGAVVIFCVILLALSIYIGISGMVITTHGIYNIKDLIQ